MTAIATSPARSPKRFSIELRIYYEDTDAAGIVYYANYLRYMERARSDWLRALGAVHHELATNDGIGFVVRDVALTYLHPARLDDLVTVDVELIECRRASLSMGQCVWLPATDGGAARILVQGNVRVAVVNHRTGRPAALPKWLFEKLKPTTN